MRAHAVFAVLVSIAPLAALAAESRCFGTVSKGRIEDSVRLPPSGANFQAYSAAGVTAGRTYVHARVAEVIVASYARLAVVMPDVKYVYGETGWPAGGSFRPHRTHQNGLSVDFFVPVRDAAGKPAVVPTNIGNRFGYDLEFDASGRLGEYTIDFEAAAEHLYQLDAAARAQGLGIAKVIFDGQYLARLHATQRGEFVRKTIPFMQAKPWVRHDEHYHVDFAVACKPLQ